MKVRGQIALAEGAYDLSEAHLFEAQHLLQGLDHKLEEIDVILRLAQLSAVRGDRAGAQRYVAELERRGLSSARPDLSAEFDQVKRSLSSVPSAGG